MLRNILSAHPAGLSEYDLLNHLRDRLVLFQSDRSNPVCLFRQHFILLHGLYRLQGQLAANAEGWLDISPLRIQLLATPPRQDRPLSAHDPLRDYYLDLDHLYQTGEAEVQALLNGFWLSLSRLDQRQEALAVLGLHDPVDNGTIRQRYRELVMQHHPDRGGETRQLQSLNAAIAALLPKI